MKRSWVKRIEKLESTLQSHARKAVVFRFGYVQYLHAGSRGERYIALTTNESTGLRNVEQCVFEERAGTSTEICDDLCFTVYLHAEDAA
jgi:hypothetical protein